MPKKSEKENNHGFDKMFSPIEVAEILNVSRGTVYMLRNSGDLRPIRIGRSLRFPKSEVERFIQERQDEADAY